jgi:hypothetical protein
MENMLSSLENPTPNPVRPTFLTVLCILTFLGSGWGIVNGISGYLTADTAAGVAQAAMQNAKDKIENSDSNPGTKMAEKMLSGVSDIIKPENLKKSALFGITSSIVTLLGAILMFQLKKTGFRLYVLGTIIAIAAPIIIFGTSNLVSLITMMGAALIGIIFIVLYALNLKYLE